MIWLGLITSYLEYDNGFKTNLPALGLALPVHVLFHTFTYELSPNCHTPVFQFAQASSRSDYPVISQDQP